MSRLGVLLSLAFAIVAFSIPGQSGSTEITLVAGRTCRVYCPVLDHATKGEEVDLQVAR